MLAQLEASCTADQGKLLYLTSTVRRYLGANGRQYSVGLPIPAAAYPALKRNPDFVRACAQTPQPDWRVVKGSGEEQWVLIDRNSFKNEGGELKFWAAYDNPFVAFDMPYDAPYAQKREHYAVNCAKQVFRQVAGYDLNADNSVTDGQDRISLTSTAIAGSNADYEMLFKLACENPQSIAQLPVFVPRAKKTLPVTLPKVSEAALSAIKSLNMPSVSKPLSYVEVVGKSTFKSTTSDMREERFLSVDAASGQSSQRLTGKSYEGNSVTFRGLFDLVRQSQYGAGQASSMKDSSSLEALTFTGDWRHMPVNGKLGYTTRSTSFNSLIGKSSEISRSNECTVVRDLFASELNATLSGGAKELSCRRDNDEYERVDTYYYLQDYGYFFFARTDKNRFYYHDLTLKTVR
ncbi:hypothetical protein ACXR0M_03375 [Pseudomonas sp. Eth.TT006]